MGGNLFSLRIFWNEEMCLAVVACFWVDDVRDESRGTRGITSNFYLRCLQLTIDHVAAKFRIPHKTTNPSEVINNPEVDVVFILAADEFHESLCISALEAGKRVFIEKPISPSLPSTKRIIAAEKAAGGAKVFVGYMRRYAPSFTAAFLREVANIPKILPPGSGEEQKRNLDTLVGEAFPGVSPTERDVKYYRFLGSLGSHDLSLMREALGFPDYKNKTGEPFPVTYESGIGNVPRFDASLAVYGEKKTGLPIKVKVDELNEHGEAVSREVLSSFEDAYTVELKDMYTCFALGETIKTSAENACRDLELFDLMYKQLAKQEGS
ncbi:hypothetical protein BKA64DRAFT_717472 [Cadophora sp. MPI-SDFR-AT-0126]|nr:hypothetical protein BKA64DRAFT_717472 [Leotiomycetes sp. MPI-SDFR-AT-0126]